MVRLWKNTRIEQVRKKLLFSTFANRLQFIYVDDEDALFATDMLFLIMTGMNLNEVIIWLLIMIIYKKQYSAKTFFTNYSYKQS